VLGLPRTGGFNPCDYRAAQMKHAVVWGRCAHGRLFNPGDGNKVAACSISRATRLSLDDCLYTRNTKKYTGDNRSILTLCNRPLLLTAWSCANMLAIYITSFIYWLYFYLTVFLLTTRQDYTKVLDMFILYSPKMIFLDRTVTKFLNTKYHKCLSTAKPAVLRRRANWEADMMKQMASFFATLRIHLRWSGYVFRRSCRDYDFLFSIF